MVSTVRPSVISNYICNNLSTSKMANGHLKEGPSQQTVDFDCRVFSGDIPEHMSILFRTVADHERYVIITMLRFSVASQLLRFFTSVISRSFITLFCSILFLYTCMPNSSLNFCSCTCSSMFFFWFSVWFAVFLVWPPFENFWKVSSLNPVFCPLHWFVSLFCSYSSALDQYLRNLPLVW